MANRKRTPFSAAGPYLARKSFTVHGEEIHAGKTFAAAVLAPLGERRAEQLFNANYFDMGTGAAHALDRDGDGDKGGRLSDTEKAALAAAGYPVGKWLKLAAAKREQVLQAALLAMASEETADDAAVSSTASSATEGGAAPADGDEAVTAPTDQQVVGYKHFGFGKYFPVNAAGQKLSDKPVGKATAAGLANSAGLELLPQDATN